MSILHIKRPTYIDLVRGHIKHQRTENLIDGLSYSFKKRSLSFLGDYLQELGVVKYGRLIIPKKFKAVVDEELHIAAKHQFYDFAVYLLSIGCPLNVRDRYKFTPLHYAVIRGDLDMIKLFVKNGADITIVNREGLTPLNLSIARNRYPSTIEWLSLYNNTTNSNSWTPLHLAAATGDIESLQVGGNLDVNTVESNGNTPLHLAILYDQRDAVSFLLKWNPNLRIKNDEQMTAFKLAELCIQDKTIQRQNAKTIYKFIKWHITGLKDLNPHLK